MRRRKKEQVAFDGSAIPASVSDFVMADWPGGSEYQRWAAWDAARTAWAEANLPNGVASLPTEMRERFPAPDQPWSEVAHTI